jgi:hypothetical protein
MPTDITIADFTAEALDGSGVFDTMMRALKGHLVQEYQASRIKGSEYATVYLGALQGTMDRALDFLMGRDKLNLELEILAIEKEKALIEKDKAEAEKELIDAQVTKLGVEIELAGLEKAKVAADTLRIQAQTDLINAQKVNQEKEGAVLDATACKLRAEFDLIMQQVEKVAAETGLINQKKVTEQAQTQGSGVDPDSVLGRQITLYGAQAEGFVRDAEQKVAKLMVDTWNTRRVTDEGTVADATNLLNDATIGRVVSKLLAGVNA